MCVLNAFFLSLSDPYIRNIPNYGSGLVDRDELNLNKSSLVGFDSVMPPKIINLLFGTDS